VFTAAVAVWLPVLVCWLSMIVVLCVPMTVTLSELPIAVACPYASPAAPAVPTPDEANCEPEALE